MQVQSNTVMHVKQFHTDKLEISLLSQSWALGPAPRRAG